MEDGSDILAEDRGGYVLLALSGAFASTGFAKLRDSMARVVEKEAKEERYLVLDLAKTTLLTSSCLEAMYSARKQGEANKWTVVITSANEDMVELFELTGFDRFFPMYRDIDAFVKEKGL
jgi:anti-anti-sigma factor